MMQTIDMILKDASFKDSLEKVTHLEKDRLFCKHGLEHLLDVARIAWVMNLESDAGYSKEVIYATGLLHDVGKYLQYEEKIPHHRSGAQMAGPILEKAGFSREDVEVMVSAIYHHRELVSDDPKSLDYILYKADKLSRQCHHCAVCDMCDWSEEQKNMTIKY